MSEFYIKKGSLNPILRVEAIQTGRNKPFLHFYEILQDSEIFFSMRNLNTGIVKVANAKCYIHAKLDQLRSKIESKNIKK